MSKQYVVGDSAIIEYSDDSSDIGKDVEILDVRTHEHGQDIRIKTDEDKEFWMCASNVN